MGPSLREPRPIETSRHAANRARPVVCTHIGPIAAETCFQVMRRIKNRTVDESASSASARRGGLARTQVVNHVAIGIAREV